MSSLLFFTHIPLLRMENDGVDFGHGALFPMPFDSFNRLTLGAFEDHRRAYEATAPVFYQVEIEVDLPIIKPGRLDGQNMLEMKIPSDNWEALDKLGWGFVRGFHEFIVDPSWVALLLAIPASALPAPRLSVTFALPPDDCHFEFGQVVGQGIHVQGDADQEYLFLSESAGPPVSSEQIEFASALVQFVYHAREKSEFAPVLSYLAATTSPTLSKFEQLTLSVIALEALLLPELRKGLQSTFRRRLSTLLNVDDDHHRELKKLANKLYGYRSAGVHGDLSFNEDVSQTINKQYAQQALAASIISMAMLQSKRLAKEREAPVSEGKPLDRDATKMKLDPERQLLDQNPSSHLGKLGRIPLENPPGLRAPNRLMRPESPLISGFSFSDTIKIESLDAPDGWTISWSPLIGLGITGQALAMGGEKEPILVPFNTQEVISMEDRDIRGDFLSKLRLDDSTLAGMRLKRQVTPLFLNHQDQEIRPFERMRNLGVLALRLAGFSHFFDPELLGWYVYVESSRYRFSTVFRQTILLSMGQEQQERVGPPDMVRIVPLWTMLACYDATARNAGIDRLLTMYRRAFDRRFLPIAARAGLMFSILEAMLGKFRPRGEPLQLHHLVTALTGELFPEPADWFEREGREFRNAVAHGFWNPQDEEASQRLDYLTQLLTSILPQFINTWLSLADRKGLLPGRVFVDVATQMVSKRTDAAFPRTSP